MKVKARAFRREPVKQAYSLRANHPLYGWPRFCIKTDHETNNKFVSHLKIITSAVSLGHDESLIVFLGENDERQYLYSEEFHNGFFRMSVGLEDIIGDLRQAMEKVDLL